MRLNRMNNQFRRLLVGLLLILSIGTFSACVPTHTSLMLDYRYPSGAYPYYYYDHYYGPFYYYPRPYGYSYYSPYYFPYYSPGFRSYPFVVPPYGGGRMIR